MKKYYILLTFILFTLDCLGQKVVNRAIAYDGTVYEIYDNGTWKVLITKLTDNISSKTTCKPTAWGVEISVNGETTSFNVDGNWEKGYILRGAYYSCTKEKDLYTISYQGYIVGKASMSLDAYTIIANHYTYSVFGK